MEFKVLKENDERIAKTVKESSEPHKALFDELRALIDKKPVKELFENHEYAAIYQFCWNMKLGYYHDFASPHPTPKLIMHAGLMDMDLHQVAGLVKLGVFDEFTDQKYNF